MTNIIDNYCFICCRYDCEHVILDEPIQSHVKHPALGEKDKKDLNKLLLAADPRAPIRVESLKEHISYTEFTRGIALPEEANKFIIGFRGRLVGVYDIKDSCVRFDYSLVLLHIIEKENLVTECPIDEVLITLWRLMDITFEKWKTWQLINKIEDNEKRIDE